MNLTINLFNDKVQAGMLQTHVREGWIKLNGNSLNLSTRYKVPGHALKS